MDGEPVDLLHAYGKRLVARWRSGVPHTWTETTVRLGQLADGRWYVDVAAQVHEQARAFANEADARAYAGQVMADRGGEWVEP